MQGLLPLQESRLDCSGMNNVRNFYTLSPCTILYSAHMNLYCIPYVGLDCTTRLFFFLLINVVYCVDSLTQ
jgi:hypothetical protein